MEKSAKSKKKIYEKSWTATASVFKTPEGKGPRIFASAASLVLRADLPTNLAGHDGTKTNEKDATN